MLVRRGKFARELEEEMRLHRELKEKELIAEGMEAREARYAAHRQFGNAMNLRERGGEAWGWRWLEDFVQDVRFGARMLRKNPGFTVVAVATLALGIGVNTAIFSGVDAVLLKPLPYEAADRLTAIWSTEIGQPETKIFAPYRDFEEFRASSRSFEELAAVSWARAGEILNWRGVPHEVLAIPASAEFFSLLGAQAALGRTFVPQDVKNGCTIVLAHAFWQKDLGATPGVAGSTLTLNGQGCMVAGVMPAGFEFYPKQTSLWSLITTESEFNRRPFDSAVGIFGRLRTGVSISSAESELAALHGRVVKEAPPGSWVRQTSPVVRDLKEQFTWLAGRNLRVALLVSWAAVSSVLLIACGNVANLLLGRAVSRQKELAIRSAVGSGRWRLMRQLLAESALLALLGAGAGILLALGAIFYFRWASVVELPPGNKVEINLYVLGFASVLATVTGLLCGSIPAWRMSRVNLNDILKRTSGSIAGGAEGWASKGLVIGEVALSLVLLTVSGLFTESMVRLGDAPLGFRPDHLLTAKIALPPGAYRKVEQRSGLYKRLIERLGALPGVEGVALASSLPPYGGGSSRLTIAGKPAIEDLEAVNEKDVNPDYFQVLGIPLLRGRGFDSRDRRGPQGVAILSEEAARKYFGNEDPVGQQIKLGRAEDEVPWVTVIGIVGNEKRSVVYQEMGYVEGALVYLPVSQAAGTQMEMAIRVERDSVALAATLQREVAAVDSEIPIYDVKTMNERYAEILAHPRFRAVLMSALAGLALLLSGIGIYGVLAQLVARRSNEIGVRMALGAERGEVMWLVMKQGMVLAMGGIAAGLLTALSLTKLIANMLFGIGPTDPATFAVVAVLLMSVSMLACYVPGRRAARVNVVRVLGQE